ncbi:DUF4236 domain-containing protein [bacterium]|nr:DUF4236 domain-containing protein [bacterium]
MGFRFRKSINLGGGFRINLSKSGIGYSFGTKGMRWTKLCNGRNRSTYSIPGTGIAYISESSGGNLKNNQVLAETTNNGSLEYSASTDIQENDAVYDDFIEQVSKITKNINVWRVFMFISCIASLFFPPLILVPIAMIILRNVFKQYFIVELNYNFDNDYEDYYSCLNLFLSELSGNKKLWGIESRIKHDNMKYSGGASTSSSRSSVQIKKKNAVFLKSNIEYYCLEFLNKNLYFLPDRMLIDNNLKISSLRYSEMQFLFDYVDFIEEESVPSDAEVIQRTWKYVNKNGSPDRRFKDNYQIPICRYGTIQMQSGNGLDLLFHFSNYNKMHLLKQLYDSLVVKRLNFTFEL